VDETICKEGWMKDKGGNFLLYILNCPLQFLVSFGLEFLVSFGCYDLHALVAFIECFC
jgi:hypothetical protein